MSATIEKKGKRTKHIHTDDMVAHLWTTRAQDSARNSRSTFYYRDSMIFSYRDNFCIGKHVTINGVNVVFLTWREYSATTKKHKRMVANALRGHNLPTFYVFRPDMVEDNPLPECQSYQDRITKLAQSLISQRGNMLASLCQLEKLYAEATQFATLFRVDFTFTLPFDLTEQKRIAEELHAKHRVSIEKKREREYRLITYNNCISLLKWFEEEYPITYIRLLQPKDMFGVGEKLHKILVSAQIVLQRRQEKDNIVKWIKGESNTKPNTDYIYLRLKSVVDPLTVETSKGAEFPLRHALRLWPVIQQCRSTNTPYFKDNNGIQLDRIGMFIVDSIDGQGNVKAGCHTLTYSEMERFYNSLNIDNKGV